MVAAGPVLEVLTPEILADVFGVHASAERHADGVVRLTYATQRLATGKDGRLFEGESGLDRGAAGGIGVDGERASHSLDAGTM